MSKFINFPFSKPKSPPRVLENVISSVTVDEREFIWRWRLEPRPEDVEKWKRGELVEPARPIVIYIDPNTPKQWVKYLILGVNDWQKAFEQAGFKNAIIGKEWPEGDSANLDDARLDAPICRFKYRGRLRTRVSRRFLLALDAPCSARFRESLAARHPGDRRRRAATPALE